MGGMSVMSRTPATYPHVSPVEHPHWTAYALCREVDPELFFPSGATGGAMKEQVRDARRICARCPVRRECAEYGMDEYTGIWGGLTGADRRRVRMARKKAS